jgi:DNA-binding NtrC family response regulator
MLLSDTTTTVAPLSILLFGRDPMLLQTRQWLLEARGYRVRTPSDLGELERMASDGPVDLLILCHSLSAEDSVRAAAAVSSRQPRARILVLTGSSSSQMMGLHAATMDSGDGPEGLLACVGRLTGVTGAGAPSSRRETH